MQRTARPHNLVWPFMTGSPRHIGHGGLAAAWRWPVMQAWHLPKLARRHRFLVLNRQTPIANEAPRSELPTAQCGDFKVDNIRQACKLLTIATTTNGAGRKSSGGRATAGPIPPWKEAA
jgi:hypothetical protein